MLEIFTSLAEVSCFPFSDHPTRLRFWILIWIWKILCCVCCCNILQVPSQKNCSRPSRVYIFILHAACSRIPPGCELEFDCPLRLCAESGSAGEHDLYKVPLPLYEAELPQTRFGFNEIFDEDTIVSTDSTYNGLTGRIHLCYPRDFPIFPCTLRLMGRLTGWKAMFSCDRRQGCQEISFESLYLECKGLPKDKAFSTVEVSSGSTLRILNSYVTGCSSASSGGLARAFDYSHIVVNGSTIRNSTSASDGGAIALFGSTLAVISSTFGHCASRGSGGAIWSGSFHSLPLPSIESTISVVGSSFATCFSSSNGGAAYISNGKLTLEHTTFFDNMADGKEGGGALYIQDVDAAVLFEVEEAPGSSVQHNVATNGGGGFLLWLGNQPSVDVHCAIGFQGSWNHCAECPIGQFKNASGTHPCAQCEPGSFVEQTGQSSCVSCPVGTVSSVTGANSSASCRPCPFRDSTSRAGSNTLADCVCDAGYTTDPVGGCLACDPGSYKSSAGTHLCSPCPAGTFASSQGALFCQSCPPGAMSNEAAASLQDCFCAAGSSGPANGPCVHCESGKYGVNGDCNDCARGTFGECVSFFTSGKCHRRSPTFPLLHLTS